MLTLENKEEWSDISHNRVVRYYPEPKDSAICSFGCQTCLMGEVPEGKGKLQAKMPVFEVTWRLRSGEEALIRNILLPIPGSVQQEPRIQPPYHTWMLLLKARIWILTASGLLGAEHPHSPCDVRTANASRCFCCLVELCGMERCSHLTKTRPAYNVRVSY